MLGAFELSTSGSGANCDRRSGAWVTVLLVGILLMAPPPAQGASGSTTRVSVASGGAQGNDASSHPYGLKISGDGRCVAFWSKASNLVPGDTNGHWDVFVRDRQAGTTVRASVSSAGEEADGGTGWYDDPPAISADGRYVAFNSYAQNLVPGASNVYEDVYVRDLQTGTTTFVSRAPDGAEGDFSSILPSISADGRFVAFSSWATNLAPGVVYYTEQAYLHDRQTGATTRVSVGADGTEGNNGSFWTSVSDDGRYVAFASFARNLVPGVTSVPQIYVRDLQEGVTALASVSSGGVVGNGYCDHPRISGNGRYIAFESWATNLVPGDTDFEAKIFIRDLETGTTTLVSRAPDGTRAWISEHPSISADGRYVAYMSLDKVPVDYARHHNVFVHDRSNGTTRRVSTSSQGAMGNANSGHPSISADGRYVAFDARASNLVPGDTNGVIDVFVHDRFGPAALSTPALSVGAPLRNQYFTVSGTLGPEHAGSTLVQLLFYRRVAGEFKLSRTVTATVPAIGNAYRARTSLPYSGSWQVIARHSCVPRHPAAVLSARRSFTVR